ncbi:uncharacterized protein [Drosophila kikkawai]|uniref:Retrotransposon gag domain-containing protein n=1 Tax=Drosophila kikkawai TaxID=30033 RepID=A0ABM4GFH6_DROKI
MRCDGLCRWFRMPCIIARRRKTWAAGREKITKDGTSGEKRQLGGSLSLPGGRGRISKQRMKYAIGSCRVAHGQGAVGGVVGGAAGDSWKLSPPRRGIPSEIASSVNAAVAQAYETHRAAASDNFSRTLQEEIRNGFLEMMTMIIQVIQPLKETAVAVRTLQQQAGHADVEADGGYGPRPRRQEAGAATGAYPKSKREEENPKISPPKPPRRHSGHADWDVGAGWFPGGQQQTTGGQRSRCQTADDARRNSAEGLWGPERREGAVRGVRIEKWEIVDGDPNKLAVEDFVFRVEYLQRQSRCSWDQVLGSFYQLMRDQAAEWYWQQVKENPPQTWDDLKESLVARFSGIGGEFERRRICGGVFPSDAAAG